ncbi:hypothetical protein QVD17_38781 [Tagetes erecta]|uniref:DUF4408 domain-containing protein n=1 Tax=Tagetes erecta TaxID=13708 RepID=A0AAD8JNT4_TARER|nr:hypothetical protein QVD17_38781 [Tagetes erecta]
MDPLRIQTYKTRTIKNHKAHQLLNDFILYSLTTLACTSFCSSPFWYPPFCATFNVFFLLSIPKITSFFFTSKALFIVGNLIVIFLLGESKFFSSNKYDAYNDVCHDKDIIDGTSKRETRVKMLESKTYEETGHEEFFELCNDDETCESNVDHMAQSTGHDEEDMSCLEHEGVEGDGDVNLPAEELNKMVDDFIARINRQRMLEAEFCRG